MDAFQAMTRALKGTVQDQPNPKHAPIVEAAKAGLKAPIDVVKLAAILEQVATETYLANCPMFTDLKAGHSPERLWASNASTSPRCERSALLDGGAPELIEIPSGADVAILPAAEGSIAFPDAFEGVTMASPPAEGAVK